MVCRRGRSFRFHEGIFVVFALLTSARLLIAGPVLPAAGFAAMAAAIAATVVWSKCRPSGLTDRIRLAIHPLFIVIIYLQLGQVVAALGVRSWDDVLLEIDRRLLGETPSFAWSEWNSPWLTGILSACYLLFFPAVTVAFVAPLIRPLPSSSRFFDGLVTLFVLGFLGYTLIPAAGPHLAFPEAFTSPPTGGIITRLNAALVNAGSNRVDVFPSLHTAVTVFLMGWLWPRHRKLFLALLLPALGLCLATLHLRYHYAIDVAAGLGLAALGLVLSKRPIPTQSARVK